MGRINIGAKKSTQLTPKAVISDITEVTLLEEPSIFQPEMEIIEKTVEIHHHHETHVDYDPSPLFDKLAQDKTELQGRIDSLQEIVNSEIIKKEALNIQLKIQKERNDELRAMIQELDVRLQLHEARITEVEERKVTEIVRVQERTPKGLMYLTIFNFILALIGFLT